MLVNPLRGLYSLKYMSKCMTCIPGGRLHDFTVGVTHIEPSVAVDPLTSPHRVCLVYRGVFPATTKSLLCDSVTTGRYLFVQINGNGVKKELLTLCELEVYGTYINSYILKPCAGWKSEPIPGSRIATQSVARLAYCAKSWSAARPALPRPAE